jgi:HSP20 family protein
MSADRRYDWMWLQAVELANQAERLQRRFVRYLGPVKGAVSWEPPVDIHESEEELILTFALPGVAPEHIELRLEPTGLTVSALRPIRSAGCQSKIRRLEIPHGRFLRRVALSGGRLRLAESQYVNGCLEVHLVRTHE